MGLVLLRNEGYYYFAFLWKYILILSNYFGVKFFMCWLDVCRNLKYLKCYCVDILKMIIFSLLPRYRALLKLHLPFTHLTWHSNAWHDSESKWNRNSIQVACQPKTREIFHNMKQDIRRITQKKSCAVVTCNFRNMPETWKEPRQVLSNSG